ncbi:hypothetical protein H6F95_22130 [Cyanobacteria bacterium FACHB-471]|nr:hypothetical protein [Cyanobacteria bacterium FACHB-471]
MDEVKPVPVHLVKEGVVFEQIIFAGMAISVGLEKSIAVLIRPNRSIIKPVELALMSGYGSRISIPSAGHGIAMSLRN